jgi:long-chain acyl-CoA synthetase
LHLDYPDATVLDLFERSATAHPEAPALDFMGRTTTYGQLAEAVRRVARGLQELGVGPGHNVALVMPNCPQNVMAFLAVLRLGATVVQHNPLYTAGELRAPFLDHGARVAVVWDKVVPTVNALRGDTALRHVVAVDMTQELPWTKRLALRLPIAKARASRDQLTGPAPDAMPWSRLASSEPVTESHPRPGVEDVALMLYTSGTTGVPKGVPLRHRHLVANVTQGQAWVPGMKVGQETFMVALPLFHAYGVTVSALLGLAMAARLVLLPKPEIGLLMAEIKRRVPTFLPAVPPLYRRIVEEAERTGVSIKGITYSLSGAMPLTAELIDRWEAATGGLLVEGYGLTETAPVVVGNPMSTQRRAGSIGVPFPDVDVRVVDPEDPSVEVPLGERGELLVRGPQVFDGYRGMPEETAAVFHDGWFRTGDVVTMAPDGFLTIVDRIKEVVITGGFNVYPSEVEDVLRRHPGVADAAVVGIPHADGGEQVVAAVVPAESGAPASEELREHCRERLTGYKVPRQFHVMDELPTNAMGKVQRREVAAMLRDA